MTINIIWAENKRNLSTHKSQTKTFNSSKEAIDWIKENQQHIVSINHKGFFMDDCFSPYDIMNCLLEKTRDGIRSTF